MQVDLKGLQYLATLLAQPGKEVSTMQLCGGYDVDGAVPVIDEQARAA